MTQESGVSFNIKASPFLFQLCNVLFHPHFLPPSFFYPASSSSFSSISLLPACLHFTSPSSHISLFWILSSFLPFFPICPSIASTPLPNLFSWFILPLPSSLLFSPLPTPPRSPHLLSLRSVMALWGAIRAHGKDDAIWMRPSQRHQTGSRASQKAEGPTSHAEKRLETLFAARFYPSFAPPASPSLSLYLLLCVRLVCVCFCLNVLGCVFGLLLSDVMHAAAAILEVRSS